MPLLHPYVRSHKITYFTIYKNSTNKLHTNILKMVIYVHNDLLHGWPKRVGGRCLRNYF